MTFLYTKNNNLNLHETYPSNEIKNKSYNISLNIEFIGQMLSSLNKDVSL